MYQNGVDFPCIIVSAKKIKKQNKIKRKHEMPLSILYGKHKLFHLLHRFGDCISLSTGMYPGKSLIYLSNSFRVLSFTCSLRKLNQFIYLHLNLILNSMLA